jgi:Icc-related predicted phosphoesterase
MNIAYTSDLHADFYNVNISAPQKTRKMIDEKLLKGEQPDILILAGDISHYNSQIVDICTHLNSLGIKVLITSGNHEFYNVSNSQRYKYSGLYDRVTDLKNLLKPLEDTYFLDGDCVTINGIKFGGAMGWYDGSFYRKMSPNMYCEPMESHWKKTMNDANLIPMLKDPLTLFASEIKKIKKVLAEQPTIMISHVCPISESIAIEQKFKMDKSSGYYTFDGLELIDPIYNEKPPIIWIHGHMHDEHEFETYQTTHLRSPLGYPGDNDNFKLSYIDLSKL